MGKKVHGASRQTPATHMQLHGMALLPQRGEHSRKAGQLQPSAYLCCCVSRSSWWQLLRRRLRPLAAMACGRAGSRRQWPRSTQDAH